MSLSLFDPLVADWFGQRFGSPTECQRLGWPSIAAGKHTLIAAPTGSGKTLAAFLVCLDALVRQWLNGSLQNGVQVIYVSPLKALSNDIQRNLQTPLAELQDAAVAKGWKGLPIRVAVRTGDTPQAERAAMLKSPPHILVTTPESLYLLLTSAKSRDVLRTCRTLIVDEIHALARDKRGSHLALSLERLAALCPQPPTRIGLSATQKPIEQMAQFLVGLGGEMPQPLAPNKADAVEANEIDGNALLFRFDPESQVLEPAASLPAVVDDDCEPIAVPCEIVDIGHAREIDLALEVPPSELAAVCSNEQWDEVYGRLTELIQTHRSTLVFVNTRRMAERVSHRLTELLGEDAVASHHGSLSRQIRHDAERRLKAGELKAIVATASLEMGIDIGYIDLVCQIGSPRSIAAALQRVGRSGHSLGALPKGRLFPLTRDELLEHLALIRAVRRGRLDTIEIPESPLDILAQQIVAAVASDDWNENDLLRLFRRAWPFRNLKRTDYDSILQMLADGVKPGSKAGAYLHRDRINGRLHARRGARLAGITSGGAIPEAAEYNVVLEDGTLIGKVDEDFAIDSSAGNIFLLGNSSWRILAIRGQEVIVGDAHGLPPNIPFWFGESPGRTIELSNELSDLRRDLAARVSCVSNGLDGTGSRIAEPAPGDPDVIRWLFDECNAQPWAAEQAARYVAAQKAAMGVVPTGDAIVFERFFDESGGMQLVIHAPLGARINRAWGLAMRKRFCRSFDFELQAAADDNGVLLSIGPQHSFAIESLFGMLHEHNGQELLEQAVLAVPMFQIRWRWNVTRALAVLRFRGGKRVPPFLQKFRAEDLLATVFPETVGCLENHHGDIVVPDHPLARQTMHDCLTEAMDITRWLQVLRDVRSQQITLAPIDTREPSPFAHQLLNAQPYAFLDDAPLEERRTRAVSTRRTLAVDDFRDLAKLDPLAIAQVTEEAWPTVRDADELHDTLLTLVVASEQTVAPWRRWLTELVRAGRATSVTLADGTRCHLAAERLAFMQAAYGSLPVDPPVRLPEELLKPVEGIAARVELIRGYMQHGGPTTADALAARLHLQPSQVFASLEALEGQGHVMRGRFTPAAQSNQDKGLTEWCERRLLARIHRLTLDGLRRRIQPVPPEVYLQYLVRHHRLADSGQVGGQAGVREALAQLQGFELPAAVWEEKILAARTADYDPQWLDHLFLCGEAVWGRLKPPKRDEKDGASLSAMTRVVPISLMLRDDLAWLVPEDRPTAGAQASKQAAEVLAALSARGALFFQDIKALTGRSPEEIEDGLRELAAWGQVTSDTFVAVRAIVRGKKTQTRWQARIRQQSRGTTPIGRWSLFPGIFSPPERDEMLQRWCKQLLSRYGVLFRDVLARESAAPSWFELVRTLRRMELRGEVRGGRFIAGVAGEQYALEAAVSELRDLRDQPPDDRWVIISAADPLNLSGIVMAGPRVAAMHKNSLVLHQGRCVASKIAGRIEFHAPVDGALQLEMRRALQVGRRVTNQELQESLAAPISGTPAARLNDRWKARRRLS